MDRRFPSCIAAAAIAVTAAGPALAADHRGRETHFERIASFPVFLNTDVDVQTVAEIVSASEDGKTLIYTDSATAGLGFVDIRKAKDPKPLGEIKLAGEPTSVAVLGDYALVGVNTSESFVNPSGVLQIVHVRDRQIVRTMDLGGQPDSVAISPDGRYAAIAIENERDEDLGDGRPPQLPAGFLVIVDIIGGVDDWSLRTVDLVGVPDLFQTDPEPEYVDINEHNICVLTMQENNHIALIDLASGDIVGDFSAGAVDLTKVDDNENDLIELIASLNGVVREPDGVTWTSGMTFVTADEGDLDGGSRGFTIFTDQGTTLHEPGSAVEHIMVRHGHYPEARSENKGNEPEAAEYAVYRGNERFLFVGSERSSVIVVYRLRGFPAGEMMPEFVQVLPAGVGPEGVLAIPRRDLLVVASEEDSREDGIRSVISIYQRTKKDANYPTVVSANRADGLPIPWAALSGLATGQGDGDDHDRSNVVYTVHDSFYARSRIYRMQVDRRNPPAVIDAEIVLNDADGVLLGLLQDLKDALPGTDDFDPNDIVNDDGTVNLDLEGIEVAGDGSFWLASEGAGNLDDGVSDPDDQPFASPNLLVHVAADGTILDAVSLPIGLVRNQFRFGFEGVAIARGNDGDGAIYVAFQRAWANAGDPGDRVRIGRYTTEDGWLFAHYPLDAPESPNGGWVGNSEITYVGDGDFVVIERDNQAGSDAAVKRLYRFAVEDVEFMPYDEVASFDVIGKSLERDVLEKRDFRKTGGVVPEKLEGLAIVDGRIFIVNDNDGVDDSNGETQLLDLGRIR